MQSKRKVPFKNIYFIFSYVWDEVSKMDFSLRDNDDDYDSVNILAELFISNIREILKFGLYGEYNTYVEEIRSIKGKICFNESINSMAFNNSKIVCEYDSFIYDNVINQIVKSTANRLYKTDGLFDEYKNKLKDILLYFSEVQIIELTDRVFDIQFNRNNNYMKLMIMICKLIKDSTILSENRGIYKFINILDDDKKMENIFELFVNRFYKCELSSEFNVDYQKPIKWKLDGEKSILPIMRMDTVLSGKFNNKTIIIDTKYYPDFMKNANNSEDGKRKLISENLYQMSAYMNNINTDNELYGILLYPMPFSEEKIDEKYSIDIVSDGKIKHATLLFRTLNLNDHSLNIKNELLDIITNL